MEKIININFQGRVIPIEETAYNNLRLYIDGLRKHFASEESGDEIISDIENRVAELFTDRLKRGAACIMSADVTAVIDSIGRLEDIEAAEAEETNKQNTGGAAASAAQGAKNRRFARNADDKIIGGVCSGIANSTGIDPVIVRVLFVLLFGALFWIYILLWIIVPAESEQERINIKRRLYRNPDDKVIAGVCGGLAAYFKVEAWKPRLIFSLPLLLSMISGSIHTFWWHWYGWHWGWGPRFFTGSLTGTMFLSYIILWIVLPKAKTPMEKLAMQGEKIDVNTIKAASQAKTNANTTTRSSGSGLGRAIGILFKAFFLFIGGTIALSLFGIFIGLFFAGAVAFPFTAFFLNSGWEYTLAVAGLILCCGVPMIALATWIIRRIMGIRSRRHYLGFLFTMLWIVGIFCVITLVGVFMSNFSRKSVVEESYALSQPATGKLYVNVNELPIHGATIHKTWFMHDDDFDSRSFRFIKGDSMFLNTVKVKVVRSADSLYHIYEEKMSRGNSPEDARSLASHVYFNISQQDSIVTLPGGFSISNKDKFRNQQVQVVIEVPVGKKIQFDDNLDNYDWFNISSNGHNSITVTHEDDDDDDSYDSNTEYIMTPSGLKEAQEAPDTVTHTELKSA